MGVSADAPSTDLDTENRRHSGLVERGPSPLESAVAEMVNVAGSSAKRMGC